MSEDILALRAVVPAPDKVSASCAGFSFLLLVSPVSFNTNHHTAMKAYDLQCARKDIHQLHQYIEKAYKDIPTFIFHKLRHHDFHTYHNAIR